MPNIDSLIGKDFYWLTVVDEIGNRLGMCACKCKCGNELLVKRYRLLSGHTRSCGCLQRSITAARNTTHGKSHLPEYVNWTGMKERCHNPNANFYENYGGRGIRVCERWLHSFENFLADMGRRPTINHTIDRIDNDKGYEACNCRWATRAEQNRNMRRHGVKSSTSN